MATLAGNSIASTYAMLLKMDATGVTSSLQKIEDGDATDSALSVSTVAAALDATDKFYFDGGSDTYIFESGADVLDIFVGGANMIKLTESSTDTVLVTGDLTVGVDGTGHDVAFFGDTSGKKLLWDQSGDELVFVGNGTKVSFYDAAGGESISADASGVLSIAAGAEIDLTATAVDLNGTLDVSGTLTVGGVTKIGASAGSGVDAYLYTAGTAAHVGLQWDADGNTEGTLIGGADDHGVDFKFFGETSGAYVQWDQSADDLVLAGAAGLDIAGDIDVDGTANLDIVDIDSHVDVTAADGVRDNGWVGQFTNSEATDGRSYGVKITAGSTAADTSFQVVDHDGSNTLFIVEGGGTVGIGTSAPSSYDAAQDDLVIAGTGNRGISIISATDGNATLAFGDGTGAAGYRGMIAYLNDGDAGMTFRTSATERMRINGDGNLGLGDNDPSEAKLSITGVASGDYGLYIDHDITDTKALYIDSEATTAPNMQLANPVTTTAAVVELTNASALTSGQIISLHSDSSSATARDLLKIYNENTSAVNATGLKIQQDAAAYGLDIDHNANQSAIHINHDGVTSGHTLFIDTPTTTSGRVLLVNDCNSLTTGSAALFQTASTALATTVNGGLVWIQSAGDTDVNVNNLLLIENDHADSTGTTCLKVQQDSTGPAISATGGIVEEGGTLKENLLTNSGFDVWSNSTLVSAASGAAPVLDGANSAFTNSLITNGGFDSDAGSWASSVGAGSAVSLASASGGKTGNCLEITAASSTGSGCNTSFTTVVGKLYQLTVHYNREDVSILYVAVGTAAYPSANYGSIISTIPLGYPTFAGTDTNFDEECVHVFEATATTTFVSIYGTMSAGQTFELDSVTCYEVTPGCVAADALAFDGWTKDSTLDIWRQHFDSTYTKEGSYYSLKTTSSAANDYIQWGASTEDPAFVERFQGRNVTFGCWAKTDEASHVRLFISDGSADTNGSYHTGGDGWEWLEVPKTMSASSDNVTARVMFDVSGETAYISQPMLVFGSSIGEGNYTRPQGEIIWFEKAVEAHFFDGSSRSDETSWPTLNLEADTYGAVPKGAKAVVVRSDCKDSGSAGTDCYFQMRADSTAGGLYINSPAGKANDMSNRVIGWQPCDENGDVQTYIEASGSLTFDIDDISIHAVQLR